MAKHTITSLTSNLYNNALEGKHLKEITKLCNGDRQGFASTLDDQVYFMFFVKLSHMLALDLNLKMYVQNKRMLELYQIKLVYIDASDFQQEINDIIRSNSHDE